MKCYGCASKRIIQSWAGQGKGPTMEGWRGGAIHPFYSNSLLSQPRRECPLLMPRSTERQTIPLTPRPWGRELGGGGLVVTSCPFKPAGCWLTLVGKKHLLNRSAYIKDNKSDMIDESAWPVTKPATAPTWGPLAPFYLFFMIYTSL